MADATYKSNQSAVIQELLLRANQIVGLPKVGLAANGAVRVGGGIHAPEETVITSALTDLSTNSATGETHLLVTDSFRPTLTAVKAAAQARIDGAAAVSFDAEIVALSEDAVSFGDIGQAVFNPKQVPDLGAWFRADTGITEAGGAISSWMAYTGVGEGILFTQSTAGAKPSLSVAEFNGRTAITFDGGDYLDQGFANIVQPATLYVVAKPANQSGDKTVLLSGDDNFRISFSGANIKLFADLEISVGPLGNFVNLFEFVLDDNNSRVGVNGSGPNLVDAGPNDGLGGLRIGAENDASAGFVGTLYEIVYYTRVLSEPERSAVRNGLAAQYRIKTK